MAQVTQLAGAGLGSQKLFSLEPSAILVGCVSLPWLRAAAWDGRQSLVPAWVPWRPPREGQSLL